MSPRRTAPFTSCLTRAGHEAKVKHVKDEATNDMVGYFGDDPGIPVIAPAGSIAVFSSTSFHRSGLNLHG